MFVKFRKQIADIMLAVADIAGALLAGSGAAVVAFFGKLMLAVVLGAISLGFFLRLVGRRRLHSNPPPSLGLRYQVPSAVIAAIEVALFVETTNLPVRFDQPGFELWHWVLVLMALTLMYSFNMWLCRSLFRRRHVVPQP